MNFKRFHESKNLFDESTLQNGYYGGGDADYSSFFPNDGYRGFQMNLNAGTYTLNITCDVSIRLLRVSNSIDGRISVSTDDQPYTFTLAGNASIYVSFRNQTTTNNYPNLKVMLNTGSTPLPYEPYSSEVWHDIPHYVHKTDTDIITTPAVIYANDTTATVGLKGNMYQASGVSPINPIQPQGTGERTGNLLFKKIPNANIGTDGKITKYSSEYGFALYVAEVEEGKTYTTGVSFAQVYALYENEPIVGSVSYNGERNVIHTGVQNITIPTGNNIKYIVLRWASTVEQTMFNEGEEALPYEPYGYFIEIEVS